MIQNSFYYQHPDPESVTLFEDCKCQLRNMSCVLGDRKCVKNIICVFWVKSDGTIISLKKN